MATASDRLTPALTLLHQNARPAELAGMVLPYPAPGVFSSSLRGPPAGLPLMRSGNLRAMLCGVVSSDSRLTSVQTDCRAIVPT